MSKLERGRLLMLAPLPALLPALLLACASSPGAPQLVGTGRHVLFVGNSYLYYADVPAIVQALADSAGGDRLAVAVVAGPDLALVDHLASGGARGAIAEGGWEWVVLQQGPSSTEANRDTLRQATRAFAALMKGSGARPALFSAWPSQGRLQDFDRAIESYRLAAADVDGLLLPVAAAWLAAWRRDSTIALYADGLHPSAQGAYLSALVVYACLLARTPEGLPSQLRLHSGGVLRVDAVRAALLQAAAAEVTTGCRSP